MKKDDVELDATKDYEWLKVEKEVVKFLVFWIISTKFNAKQIHDWLCLTFIGKF